MDRLDLYLQWGTGADEHGGYYVNTEQENILVNKFNALYNMAKSAQESDTHCSPENLDKWRKAYLGTLNALDKDGNESKRPARKLRRMAYELIESKIDNTIPMPKMQPRYKSDIPLVTLTENYLKFEADRIITKYVNDKNERATYIDGTSWYKVWWDSLDNTHERSGDVKIEHRSADQIIPQPGVTDYKQLEYIFERQMVSISRIYDLYGRLITPISNSTNVVEIVSCYYLNEDRIVGLFSWSPNTMQVVCNEHDWQIRKVRKCTRCGTINPRGDTCTFCGNKHFKYENAEEEILEEPLVQMYNPYEVGESDNPDAEPKQRVFAERGTRIPYYRLNQLPFVPRPAISDPMSIYGVSEVFVVLDNQDMVNKVWTKAVDKTLKSGAVVTKPSKIKMSDKDDTFKVLDVRSAEEAQMVNAKQIVADTSQDILVANLLYDSGKAASGVTDSFQGARDTTATSGKAKQFSAMQSAGRIESLRVMKSSAFSGVYELLFKYLLAFSDEPRKFVRILPDGKKIEQTWNKYMFLDRDKYGTIYYRDDFHFTSDGASTLSQNRAQMWQETDQKFVQGCFGNPQDPRVLKNYWNILDALQYPLASVVLAAIEDQEQHLPPQLEAAIMANPELLNQVMATVQGTADGRGGARPNSGPDGNGATHSANVERTNERNRAANKDVAFSPQQVGGSV